MGPLNGTDSRGCKLNPSSSLITARSSQSETYTLQSGKGMFTRRLVFWVRSGTVNTLLGNGPVVGCPRAKRARTPLDCTPAPSSVSAASASSPTLSVRVPAARSKFRVSPPASGVGGTTPATWARVRPEAAAPTEPLPAGITTGGTKPMVGREDTPGDSQGGA